VGKAAKRRSREQRAAAAFRRDPAYRRVDQELAIASNRALAGAESASATREEAEVMRQSVWSLRTLEVVRAERARLEELEREAVVKARAGGASWQRIGTALGVTKSAACQRFGRQVEV
jgi:hypothetical protein